VEQWRVGDVPVALGELLERALAIQRAATGREDFDGTWPLLHEARPFGRVAFDEAVALLASDDAAERMVGCDLLGALCDPDEQGWGPEVALAVVRMADTEVDPDVLWSVANALGFAEDHQGLATLIRLAGHGDSGVRFQVATALPSCEEGGDPQLLALALIGLMEDPDEDVRDWATFGLGTLTELDGPEVREALVGRLSDENRDARDEALLGLARRRDRRVLPVLAARLGEDEVGRLAVEAAAYLCDERLLGPLSGLADWWDVDPDMLDEAVAACDPEQQARDVDEQATFLALLEPALGAWPGVSAALCCERLEREVLLLTERGGRTGRYDFGALVGDRAGGDLSAAVRAVLTDLNEPLKD